MRPERRRIHPYFYSYHYWHLMRRDSRWRRTTFGNVQSTVGGRPLDAGWIRSAKDRIFSRVAQFFVWADRGALIGAYRHASMLAIPFLLCAIGWIVPAASASS